MLKIRRTVTAFSEWMDSLLGVPRGTGLLTAWVALVVALQLFWVLAQTVCPPCRRAIFAVCRLIEQLL